MRLIDADANIETMKKCAENPEDIYALLCYRYAQRVLEEAPTVEPVPPWHRVEEELPSMDGYDWVLGVVNGGCRNLKYENAIMEVSYDPEYKEWFIDDLPEAKITVTHWMPLPEPPKEDA